MLNIKKDVLQELELPEGQNNLGTLYQSPVNLTGEQDVNKSINSHQEKTSKTTPPPNNMGVLVVPPVKTLSFQYDYITFTIPKSCLTEFLSHDYLNEQLASRGFGGDGYKDSSFLANGGVCKWSDTLDHVCFNLPSQSLNHYFPDTWEVIRLLKYVKRVGGNVSRLDYCFDLKNWDGITMGIIRKDIERGCLVSRARTIDIIERKKNIPGGGLLPAGQTIYIGSRESNKLLRIYDKAAEQGLEGEVWVRFEMQFRHEDALSVGLKFIESWFVGVHELIKSAFGIMLSFVDFREVESYSNINRRIRLSWYESLICGVDKVQLIRHKVRLTIQRVSEWIERQVAPSLSALKDYYGSDFYDKLRDIIRDGKLRRSARLDRAIADTKVIMCPGG